MRVGWGVGFVGGNVSVMGGRLGREWREGEEKRRWREDGRGEGDEEGGMGGHVDVGGGGC